MPSYIIIFFLLCLSAFSSFSLMLQLPGGTFSPQSPSVKKRKGLLKARYFDSMTIILLSFSSLILADANLILATPPLALL